MNTETGSSATQLMTATEKSDGAERLPLPFQELLSKLNSYKTFWATRKAIVRGEPLYDYTASQLKDKKLMGPWTFNTTQSALSALAAVVTGKIIAFFYPPPEHPPVTLDVSASGLEKLIVAAEPIKDSIYQWLSTGLAPFTLLVVATMVAWASLYKTDHSPEKHARARNAYLYFDGAYGFFSQALLALASVALISSAHIKSQKAAVPIAIWIAAIVSFLVGLIWQTRLTNISLAAKLFQVNGYSSKRRTLFNIRTQIENPGPWELYRLVAISGVGAFYWIMAGVLFVVSYAVAIGIVEIKSLLI